MEFKVIKKQSNSNDCILCGLKNKLGFQASFFELENKVVACQVTAKNEHQSYPGRVHGGMISVILDETIGRTIMISEPNTWGVTGNLSVKFKKPVPIGEPLTCFGKITQNTQRGFLGEGFIEDQNGNVLATGSGTFVKCPIEKIAGHGNTEDALGWEVVLLGSDPKKINMLNYNFFSKC